MSGLAGEKAGCREYWGWGTDIGQMGWQMGNGRRDVLAY
jgi:hypothetical protein